MHRIDGAGATSDNRFTDGDPASATAATVVTDDWLNAVQEEIVSVISDPAVTPVIALDKTKTNQLVTAIKRIISASAIAYSQATETVLGVMKVATQAQVDAGVDDATIVTPKKLRWGFSISKAANGYIGFPSWLGGLVIQWGTHSFTTSSVISVTLPVTYPTANLWASIGQGVNAASLDGTMHASPLSTSQIQLQFANGSGSSCTGFWLSIGY